jgi:hypothetical protein
MWWQFRQRSPARLGGLPFGCPTEVETFKPGARQTCTAAPVPSRVRSTGGERSIAFSVHRRSEARLSFMPITLPAAAIVPHRSIRLSRSTVRGPIISCPPKTIRMRRRAELGAAFPDHTASRPGRDAKVHPARFLTDGLLAVFGCVTTVPGTTSARERPNGLAATVLPQPDPTEGA